MSKLFATIALIATGINVYVLWQSYVGGGDVNIPLALFGSLGFVVSGLLWAWSNKKKQKAAPACSDCDCDHK